MRLIYRIQDESPEDLRLYSKLESEEGAWYDHGVFDNVAEIVESIRLRKEELMREFERSW